MNDQFLFVVPSDENDTLAEILPGIREYAKRSGCRFVISIGRIQLGEPTSQVEQFDPETTEEEHPPIARRQSGATVFLSHPEYPTNDDLAAVRVEFAKFGKNPIRVMVVNTRYGEVELAILAGNELATIYSISEVEEVTPDGQFRKEVLDQNLIRVSNVKPLQEVHFLAHADTNQNVDAIVLVDPRPGDFEAYGRHLRHRGILLLVSTNGTSPDRPEKLADKLIELTPSVLAYHDEADSGTKQQQ